jgi:hypothetical protein
MRLCLGEKGNQGVQGPVGPQGLQGEQVSKSYRWLWSKIQFFFKTLSLWATASITTLH